MKKFILSFIALFLSICFISNVSANIVFSIKVQQIKEKQDSDKKISREETDSDMSVEISDNYFSYIQDGTMHIFDFADKRIFTINLSNKIFSNDSLFSNIGFRTYEFQNRLMLGGALAAAGIEDNPMLPVFSEHLFSLQQKDKKSELSHISKDDSVSFSAAGKELLTYSKQGDSVTLENKEMFIKFFRYVFGGHPQILEKLLSDNVIPKSISIHRYDAFNEIYTLTTSTIEKMPDKSFTLEGYSPGVLPDETDQFSKFLSDIKYSKTINLESHLELLLSKANDYFQNGNYMDTMLAYLEFNLASGLSFPPIFHEQKLILNKDENVKKLLTALSPKSKEKAEEFLVILQESEGKAKYQGHVIKIFEANIQMSLGNYQEAKKLFHEALIDSPYITGAYKDLGGLYFDEYNTVLAWRCWDVARKIAPTHKMLIPINEFESKLAKDYPKFF